MRLTKKKRIYSAIISFIILIGLHILISQIPFFAPIDSTDDADLLVPTYAYSGTFMSESGTELDPYVIGTRENMESLSELVKSGQNMTGKFFVIDTSINELDLGNFQPIGSNTQPFNGNFNGSGINFKLSINRPSESYIGLFGYASGGSIKNLTVSGIIQGDQYVGSVLGYNNGSIVTTVYNTATVIGTRDYIGGIMGVLLRGTIKDAINQGHVMGQSYVGGVIGYSYRYQRHGSSLYYQNTILNVYNRSKVQAKTANVGDWIGGYSSSYYSSYNQLNSWTNIHIDTNYAMLNMDMSVYGFKDKTVRNDTSYLYTQQFVDGTLKLTNFTDGKIVDSFGYYPVQTYFTTHTNPIIQSRLIQHSKIDLSDGIGSIEHPFLIRDEADMIDFSNRVNASNTFEKYYFKVETTDSRFILPDFVPIGSPTKPFYGSFDGNWSLFELSINRPDQDYQALFGGFAKGYIKNLTISGQVIGKNFTAGVLGRLGLGQGLDNLGGQVYNVNNLANIQGESYVGGIVGYISSGSVKSTYNEGRIQSTLNYSGGITGFMYGTGVSASVEESYNRGRIIGQNYVGGITGYFYQYYRHSSSQYVYSTLKNNYNSGLVSGASSVFGHIGYTNLNHYSSFNQPNTNSNNIYDDSINVLFIPEVGIKPPTLQTNGLTSETFFNSTLMMQRGFSTNFWTFEEKTSTTGYYPQLKSFMDSGVTRVINDAIRSTSIDIRDGLGTELNPFLIRTKEDMDQLSSNVLKGNTYQDYFFKVEEGIDQIDLENFIPIGDATKPFRGTFDGNGVNFNVSMDQPTKNYMGIFGLADMGVIKNFSVSGFITGQNYVGSVIGYMQGVEVYNVYNTATIIGASEVGGIVGRLYTGSLKYTFNMGSIYGTSNVGGNIGYSYRYARHSSSLYVRNTIQMNYNAGTVKAKNTTVGGNIGSYSTYYYSSYSEANPWSLNVYDARIISFDPYDANFIYKPNSIPDQLNQAINQPRATLLGATLTGFVTREETETHDFYPEIEYFRNHSNEAIQNLSKTTVIYDLKDGLGTLEHPFKIYDETDMWKLSTDVKNGATFEGFYFKVVTPNTTFNLPDWQPIGNIQTSFLGSFDGNWSNFNISINQPTLDYQGLFGVIGMGEIKYLSISGSITGKNYVGSVAGRTGYGKQSPSLSGRIHSVFNEAIITGDSYVGGIVGLQDSGMIEQTFNIGKITGKVNYLGGITGFMNGNGVRATTKDSYNTGDITGNQNVGGITGYFYQYYRHSSDSYKYMTLSNTYNKGNISGITSVFGHIGFTNLSFYSSYNQQNVNQNNTYDSSLNALFVPSIGIKPPALASNALTSDNYFDGLKMQQLGLSSSLWTFKEKDTEFGYYPQLSTFIQSGIDRVIETSLQSVTRNIEGGLGTEGSPFIIETKEDMDQLSYNVSIGYTFDNYYFIVKEGIDQIDLGDFDSIGKPGKPFRGTFDGNGVDFILSIDRTLEDRVALFGFMDKGTIKNLSTSGFVTGRNFVSAILAESHGALVTNVYNAARILGTDYVGGLVGYLRQGELSSSMNYGLVEGARYVGGLVGALLQYYRHASDTYYYSTIKNLYNASVVRASTNIVGGVWGYLNPNYYSSYNQQNIRQNVYYDTGVLAKEPQDATFGFRPSTEPGVGVAVSTGALMNQTASINGFIKDGPYETYGYYPLLSTFSTHTLKNIEDRLRSLAYIDLTGGLGTVDYPFLIETKADLDNLSLSVLSGITFKGNYFKIKDSVTSIDLENFKPIGKQNLPFEGHFDGNFKLLIVSMNPTEQTFGLFGELKGVVENLYIQGTITTTQNVGGFVAGRLTGGTIKNTFASGEIQGGTYMGGLVGVQVGGKIEQSGFYGKVVGTTIVGGILGQLHSGQLLNLYTRAEIIGTTQVGGIVGTTYQYNRVSSSDYTSNSIHQVYSASLVSSTTNLVGGVIGYHNPARYSSSGANARVNNYYDASILKSYTPVGGFKPSAVISQTALEKTSMLGYEMQQLGFSDSIWKFEESVGNESYYPQILMFTTTKESNLKSNSKLSVTTTPLLGDGTNLSPYLIRTVQDMMSLSVSVQSGFDTTDIYYQVDLGIHSFDLSTVSYVPIGNSTNPFKGHFNGSYANFNLNLKSNLDYQGLFGVLSSDATVAYLSVSGNIQGLSYVGGVAGYSEGQIENIYVDAYLKGNAYVGGITGSNLGILTYGYFKGNIEAETGSYIGGISGFNQGSISEFYVNAMLNGLNHVGGVIGYNSGTVSNSYYNHTYYIKDTNSNKVTKAISNQENQDDVKGLDKLNMTGLNSIGSEAFQMNLNVNIFKTISDEGLFIHMPQLNGFSSHPLTVISSRSKQSVRIIRFEQGEGTKDDPYIIKNETEMALLSQVSSTDSFSGIYFKASPEKIIFDLRDPLLNYKPIGTFQSMFKGGFDGNYQTFLININQTNLDYQGLFGVIGEGALIKNIDITGSVTGRYYVGGLAGMIRGATIENVSNKATIKGARYTGGIAGDIGSKTNVRLSYNMGNVTGTGDATGGIAGILQIESEAREVFNYGAITGVTNTGGIAGLLHDRSLISYAYNRGEIRSSGAQTGGIVGLSRQKSVIDQVYVASIVRGLNQTSTGSIAGLSQTQSVENNAFYDVSVLLSDFGLVGVKPTKAVGNKLDQQDLRGVMKTSLTGLDILSPDGTNYGNYISLNPNYFNLTESIGLKRFYPELKGFSQSFIVNHQTDSKTSVETFVFDGLGTSTSPYIIYSAYDMVALSDANNDGISFENTYFKVHDTVTEINLSLSGLNYQPIGNETQPFQGIFDGNYVNFILQMQTNQEAGLFGYIGELSIVKNLSIEGSITGQEYVGAIAGYNNGLIENVYSVAHIQGENYVGGLVGYNQGILEKSYIHAEVNGLNLYTGGMVGYNKGTITDGYASVYVRGFMHQGMLIGYSDASAHAEYLYYDLDKRNEINPELNAVSNLDEGTLLRGIDQNILSSHKAYEAFEFVFSSQDIFKSASSVGMHAYFPQLKGFMEHPQDFIRTKSKLSVTLNRISGAGTKENPYLIKNALDMVALSELVTINKLSLLDKYVEVLDGIEMIDLTDPQLGFLPIGNQSYPFRGHFNAKFTEFIIDFKNISTYAGLFGYIGKNGTVTNVIVSGSINGGRLHGGIAGRNQGTISNSQSHVEILVNQHSSYNAYAGGITAYNEGFIENSFNSGTVHAEFNYAGGIAGYHAKGASIINSFNVGNVSSNRYYAGGIAGYSLGRILNVYNSSLVTGTYAGAIVGYSNQGTLLYAYYDKSILETSIQAKKATKAISNMDDEGFTKGLYRVEMMQAWHQGFLFDTDQFEVELTEGLYGYLPQLKVFNDEALHHAKQKMNDSTYKTIFMGDGSLSLPYLILSEVDLLAMSNRFEAIDSTNLNFKVQTTKTMFDLSNSNVTYQPIGSLTHPFKGNFDGHNIEIKLNLNGNDYLGLFGVTSLDAQIKNIHMSGLISGKNYVGSIIGYNQGQVENVTSSATIQGERYVGGLLGFSSHKLYEGMYEGALQGKSYVGGLVGYLASSGSVEMSYHKGYVRTELSYTGGIAGYAETESSIQSSFNMGLIESFGTYLGGLVGYLEGSIESSYNRGDIVGYNLYVGGISGYSKGSMNEVYHAGKIYGLGILGGLVGQNEGQIQNAYYDLSIIEEARPNNLLVKPVQSISNQPEQLDVLGLSHEYMVGTDKLEGVYKTMNFNPETWYLRDGNDFTSYYPELLSFNEHSLESFRTDSYQSIKYQVFDGEGTLLNPYIIKDAKDMKTLQLFVEKGFSFDQKHFKVKDGVQTIDLTDQSIDYRPIGLVDAPFEGHFNGNGANFIMVFIEPGENNLALFYLIGENASVKNINISGSIIGNSYLAALAVRNEGLVENIESFVQIQSANGNSIAGIVSVNKGSIQNAYNHGHVMANGSYVAGIVAENDGTIKNSFNKGMIKGLTQVAGIAGIHKGIIELSYNMAAIEGDTSVGGVAGETLGVIGSSFNHGTIYAKTGIVGGMSGYMSGSSAPRIYSSYNTGLVYSDFNLAGGILGVMDTGTVIDTYSAAGVYAKRDVGAIIGQKTGGVIERSYYDQTVLDNLKNYSGIKPSKAIGNLSDTTTVKPLLRGHMTGLKSIGNQTNQMNFSRPNDFIGLSSFDQFSYYQQIKLLSTSTNKTIAEDSKVSVTTHTFAYGSGKQNDPFMIMNETDMIAFADTVNSGNTYQNQYIQVSKQVGTLDFTNEAMYQYVIVGQKDFIFNGSFDGNGTTFNVSILQSRDYVGLFGRTGKSAVIKNISVKGSIEGLNYTGGIVGYSEGILMSSYNQATVKGLNYTGGLIGQSTNLNEFVYNRGDVYGKDYVGGIIGHLDGLLHNSYQSGILYGQNHLGTLVGFLNSGAVENSYYDRLTLQSYAPFGTWKKPEKAVSNSPDSDVVFGMDPSFIMRIDSIGTASSQMNFDLSKGYWTTQFNIQQTNKNYPQLAIFSKHTHLNVLNDSKTSTERVLDNISYDEGLNQGLKNMSVIVGYHYQLNVPTKLGYRFIGYFKTDSTLNETQMTNDLGISLLPYDGNNLDTLIAKYELRSYEVKFVDGNNQTIQTTYHTYGDLLTIPSIIPLKNSTNEWIYTFESWNYDFSKGVDDDLVITANYQAIPKFYKVIFYDGNGLFFKEIYVEYQKTISIPSEIPRKLSSGNIAYQFSSWNYDFDLAVTSPLEIYPIFMEVDRYYTVIFHDALGNVIETQTVEYLQSAYDIIVKPVKEASISHTYEFVSWSESLKLITKNLMIHPIYEEKVRNYEVTFIDGNGQIYDQLSVPYLSEAIPKLGYPLKNAFEMEAYQFIGWNQDISEITSDLTVHALYQTIDRYYKVYWYDGDSNLIHTDLNQEYLSKLNPPSIIPTKTKTDQYQYEFNGWSESLDYCLGEMHIYATFDEVLRPFEVKFYDGNGALIYSETVLYGQEATFPSDLIVRKKSSETEAYKFTGWNQSFNLVTTDLDIYPEFISVEKYYFITFMGPTGSEPLTVQRVEYGYPATPPVLEPYIHPNIQYEYIFMGWSEDLDFIDSDLTVYTRYEARLKTFEVRFVNGDEEVIVTVGYGAKAIAPTPYKSPTDQVTYEFIKWSDSFDVVTSNLVIYAEFEARYAYYIVTFLNGDGSILETQHVLPNQHAKKPVNPTKVAPDQKLYIFIGWDQSYMDVTEDLVIEPVFNLIDKYYVIRYFDAFDVLISRQVIEYGQSALIPDGPIKPDEGSTHYTFRNWSVDASFVDSNQDIYPIYDESLRTYKVIFKDGDGNIISEQFIKHGMSASVPLTTTKTPHDNDYYLFMGWNQDAYSVLSDLTIEPIFKRIDWHYQVRFIGDGGVILDEQTITYGNGAIDPIRQTPIIDRGDGYVFVVTGWDKNFDNIQEHLDVYAIYGIEPRDYIVRFFDLDGNLIHQETVVYGTDASAPILTPPTHTDPKYLYTFSSWDQDYTYVRENLDIYPIFEEVLRTYEVRFIDGDGRVFELQTVTFNEGAQTPNGIPQKSNSETHSYVFRAWDKSYDVIKNHLDVFALFDMVELTYIVRFVDTNGVLIKEERVGKNQDATAPFIEPIEPTDEFIFSYEWSKSYQNVTNHVETKLVIVKTVREYTYTFKDYLGNIIKEVKAPYGTTIIEPNHPLKPMTASHQYEFIGWSPTVDLKLTKDVVFTPLYDEVIRTYTIRFIDGDGLVVDEQKIPYGGEFTYPSYIPTKKSTKQYIYTFKMWDTLIMPVRNDLTIEAIFDRTLQSYEVIFIDEAGNTLKIETVFYGYGATEPTNIPTKPMTPIYEYMFIGWDKQFNFIEGDLTVQTRYVGVLRKYVYTFYDDDGTTILLQMTDIYGAKITQPTHPTKESLEFVRFEFMGWDKVVPDLLTDHIHFVAQYKEIWKTYQVIFLNGNGTVLEVQTINHGMDASLPSVLPSKMPTVIYEYIFSHWNQSLASINKNMTIEPVFEETLRTYTVTYLDHDGTYLGEKEVKYGMSGVGLIVTPKRMGHGFTGWDQNLIQVKSDMTVKATYMPYQYQIRFNDNGADSGYLESMIETYGNQISLPNQVYEKRGYFFAGWKVDPDSDDVIYADGEAILFEQEGLDLYAEWIPIIYQIEYILDGGTAFNPTTYTIKDSLNLQGAYKEDYIFLGWELVYISQKSSQRRMSGSSQFIEKIDEGTIGNITLKAIYEYNGWIKLKENSTLGLFHADITAIIPVDERTPLETDNPIYLMGVFLGQTLENLRGNFDTEGLVFLDANQNVLSDTDVVRSGMMVVMYDKEDPSQIRDLFTVILKGDVNGDGLVTFIDINTIINHVNGNKTIPAYMLLSALTNGDEIINFMDINGIVNHVNGSQVLHDPNKTSTLN